MIKLSLILSLLITLSACSSTGDYIEKNVDGIIGYFKGTGALTEFKKNSEYSWYVSPRFKKNYFEDIKGFEKYKGDNLVVAVLDKMPSDVSTGAISQILEVGGLIPDFISVNPNELNRYLDKIRMLLIHAGSIVITRDLNSMMLTGKKSDFFDVSQDLRNGRFFETFRDENKTCENLTTMNPIDRPYCFIVDGDAYKTYIFGGLHNSRTVLSYYPANDKGPERLELSNTRSEIDINEDIIVLDL